MCTRPWKSDSCCCLIDAGHTNWNLAEGRKNVEGAALKHPLGCKLHPRPRQRRMQLDEKNEQLPAEAMITQRPVSGQASEAGRAVRKAHSESQADRPENECIHFPAGFLAFLCPETRLACFKFQAQIVCFLFQAGSPGWVQGAKSPGSGARGLKKPSNVSLPPLNSSLY